MSAVVSASETQSLPRNDAGCPAPVYGGQEVQIEVRNQHVTAIYQAYPGHDFGGGGTWEQYEESDCTC